MRQLLYSQIQVVKGSMDMIWPAVDCGVTFSSMGITLALIRRQLKELDKKLDLILEKDRKVALDKLREAMISLENRNHEAARDNFQRYLFESFEGSLLRGLIYGSSTSIVVNLCNFLVELLAKANNSDPFSFHLYFPELHERPVMPNLERFKKRENYSFASNFS